MKSTIKLYTLFNFKSLAKALLYSFVFYKLVYPGIVRYFGFPQVPSLISEILIWFALLITILLIIIRRKRVLTTKELTIHRLAIGMFILLLLASAFHSSDNVFILIKSIMGFWFPALLLYFLIMEINLSESEQLNFLKYLFAVIFVQIPITIYQAVVISPINADSNSGTISYADLGGTGILSILEAFLFSIILIAFLYKKFKIKYLLLSILVLIPAIAGGSRFGIIIIPFAFFISVVCFALYHKEVLKKKLLQFTLVLTMFISVFITILIFVIPNTKYSHFLNLDIFSSINRITEYDESAGEYSRTRGYYLLFNNYFKSTEDYLIGRGPGSITSSETVGKTNPELAMVINLPDSIQIIASLGITGLAMIIFIVLLPIFIVKQHVGIESNEFFKIVATAIPSLSILVILSLFYAPTWNSQIGIVYWLIIGIILDRYRVFKHTEQYLTSLYSKNFAGSYKPTYSTLNRNS